MTAPGAPSGSTGGLPPVGGLADEAAQLLDALATRLALVRGTIGDRGPVDPRPAADDVDAVGPVPDVPDPATGHLQCVGWCPVCRSADLLRGERPEVAGKLVDSALVVITALRSLLPSTPTAGHTAAQQPASGPSGGTTPPPQPGIERIDIR